MIPDCAHGRHGELRDSAPHIGANSVNVEHACERCGVTVSVTSYTRAEWDRQQAKQAKQAKKGQLR